MTQDPQDKGREQTGHIRLQLAYVVQALSHYAFGSALWEARRRTQQAVDELATLEQRLASLTAQVEEARADRNRFDRERKRSDARERELASDFASFMEHHRATEQSWAAMKAQVSTLTDQLTSCREENTSLNSQLEDLLLEDR